MLQSFYDQRLLPIGKQVLRGTGLLRSVPRRDSYFDQFANSHVALERRVHQELPQTDVNSIYERQWQGDDPLFAAAYERPAADYWMSMTPALQHEPMPIDPEPGLHYPNPADVAFVEHAVEEFHGQGAPEQEPAPEGLVEGDPHLASFEQLAHEPFFQYDPNLPDPATRFAYAQIGAIADPDQAQKIEQAIQEAAAPEQAADHEPLPDPHDPMHDPFHDPYGPQAYPLPYWFAPGMGGW